MDYYINMIPLGMRRRDRAPIIILVRGNALNSWPTCHIQILLPSLLQVPHFERLINVSKNNPTSHRMFLFDKHISFLSVLVFSHIKHLIHLLLREKSKPTSPLNSNGSQSVSFSFPSIIRWLRDESGHLRTSHPKTEATSWVHKIHCNATQSLSFYGNCLFSMHKSFSQNFSSNNVSSAYQIYWNSTEFWMSFILSVQWSFPLNFISIRLFQTFDFGAKRFNN